MKRNTVALILASLMLFTICAGCNVGTVDIFDPAGVNAEYDSSFDMGGAIDSFELDGGEFIDIGPELVPLAGEPAFSIPVPTAPGTNAAKNAKAEIDYSNAKDGYVMVKYIPAATKPLKVVVIGPSGAQYPYNLKQGVYEVFPLSDGNGKYKIAAGEVVDGGKMAVAQSVDVNVTLSNEFAPFIRSNQYVNYTKDSKAVQKAADLVKNAKTDIDKVNAIYTYVKSNFKYDTELAKNVKAGYVPNIDDVLAKGKGICFDYAAVTTAMLRSQGIATKMVFGNTGTTYHAWISVYSKELGWVDGIVQFDGKSWKLMDPTFASSGAPNNDLAKYIGDGKNYTAKLYY